MTGYNQTQHSALGTHALYLLALAVYILAGMVAAPFHGDESTQVYMSRDYAYLALDHDLQRVLYSENPVSLTEQQLRLLNGTLPKYLIGLSWHLAGFTPADLNEQWDWSADWNYNQQTGHAPTPELLFVSRWPQALLLAAGIFPLFALGWRLGGGRVAYLATLYYALHPALLLNGRRAMMEGSLTFFSLLVVLAGVWWITALTPNHSSSGRGEAGRRRNWFAALVLGTAAGLALASKHTALLTLAAVFGVCGVYAVYGWMKGQVGTRYIVSLQLVFAAVVAVAIVFALNPAWWSAPLQMPGLVLELREGLLQLQITLYGGYSDLLHQVSGFLRQVFIAQPQYYEVPIWQAFIGDQIARYEATLWSGVSVGGSPAGGVVLAVMMIAGAWVLARQRGNMAARLMVSAWALVVMPGTLLLTPLEWQRYYLPVYPVVGLLAAVGVDAFIRRLLNRHDARNADIKAEMT